MRKSWNIVIVAALITLVSAVIVHKQYMRSLTTINENSPNIVDRAPAEESTSALVAANQSNRLPRIVDLGAGKCIPCKMMAPILEELKTEYAGILMVDFIDVWENPDEGKKYSIRMIPTQIFYDASGKELFRHEGFFSKADILAKWKELGIVIESKQE
jgi:thioredoxin 1